MEASDEDRPTTSASLSAGELAAARQRSDISRRRLADEHTPFIHNCWYVALRGSELGRSLLGRRILGMSVVLYRTEAGEPVALQDRCGHRSFPLSRSDLVGDTIRCGYHGLRYDREGLCVEVPGQSSVRGRFGVRAYPVVEKGPFVWIWPGDRDRADPGLIPDQPWIEQDGWDVAIGYALANGNYVHLHENLLDLSHLTFLHANSFGTPEYARTPVEIAITPDDIQAWRNVECVLPDLYADALGWTGERAKRCSGSQMVSPALHVNTGLFENLERGPGAGPPPTVKVSQLITPESQGTTHYHYALARNFALEDPAIGPRMLKGLSAAFEEDLFALDQLSRMLALAGPDGVTEFDIATDRAGLEMRRRFRLLADAERPEAGDGRI